MKIIKPLNKKQKIELISTIILFGFFSSVVYHYYFGVYHNMGYPFTTFLFRPNVRWSDFLDTLKVTQGPYQSDSLSVYFPFAYIISHVFDFFKPKVALGIYLVFCTIGFILICIKQIKINNQLSLSNLLIISLLSYPFLFTLDRANYEFLVFFALYFFIYFFDKQSIVSAIFLSFAISFKAFPAILAILYRSNRKLSAFVTATILSLSLTFFSYALLPEGLITSIKMQLSSLSVFSKIYYVGNEGMFFGNSLFGAFKYLSYWTDNPIITNLSYYTIIGISFVIIIWWVLFIENKLWKKVALLIFALNLFPQMSADYKLLHVFLPLFLFFDDESQENGILSFIYSILFGLLLIPKDYFRLNILPEASISILLNPLIMVILSLMIIVSGLLSLNRQKIDKKKIIKSNE